MRKNLLALSIAAMVGGLSGAANAQAIFTTTATTNLPDAAGATPGAQAGFVGALPTVPDTFPAVAMPAATALAGTEGAGHILVVPYFTSQGTNHSLLNIVNTDLVNGKAVKLRYRGASNSDDVFDITVYLSPGDMWTADVAVDGQGFSRLVTNDTSCTLPSIADIKADNNGRFKVNRVRNSDAAQTREGYIEILNTADIPPRLSGTTTANPLFTATKHVNGVAPCTAAVMDLQATQLNNTNPDSADTPRNRGYSYPTGGLFANWTIVNVETNASFSGEATALRAVDGTGANAAANVVWFPQTTDTVATTVAANLTADGLLATGAVRPAMYDFPDLSTPYAGAADPTAQAVTLANQLATASVTNEYLTAATSGGFATDWVFSMPTRRYAMGVNYAANAIVRNTGNAQHFAATNTVLVNGQICVDAGNQRGYDREESSKTTFVISPSQGMRFCGETSVLSFNSPTSAVLGAQIATQQIQTSFAEGWFTLRTPGAVAAAGLPVIGYAAAKANSGNLGGTWAHRTTR